MAAPPDRLRQGVRVRPGGIQRWAAREGSRSPDGAALPHRPRVISAADGGQGHPRAGVAERGLCRVLQQALADLNAAYRNYFACIKGARKGPKAGKPKFRSRKDHRQAIRFTANARFKVLASGKLRLPKIGDVPVRWSRPLPSEPSSVTIIKDSAGRYFASFVVQVEPETLPEAEPATGVDLGLKHFAVLSDGRKIDAPRFLRRAEKR